MATLMGLITILENMSITKEVLESTRLGRHINEIRRRTRHESLFKRTKDLVREWRKVVFPENEAVNGVQPSGPGPGGTAAAHASNRVQSPSLPSSGQGSPRIASNSTASYSSCNLSSTLASGRSHNPASPSVSCALSPRLVPQLSGGQTPLPNSVKHSRPPSPSSESKQQPLVHKDSYSPSAEVVSRTIASNKRLRKEDSLPPAKRLRSTLTNGYDDDCSRESFSSVISLDCASQGSDIREVPVEVTEVSSCKPKRGRPRKESRGTRRQKHPFTAVEVDASSDLLHKVSAVGPKTSKVKTTSQIVAELAERKGDSHLAERASELEEKEKASEALFLHSETESVRQNKMEHMQRFLTYQQPNEDVSEDEVINIDDDDDEEDMHTRETSSPDESLQPSSTAHPTPSQTPMPAVMPSNLELLGVGNNESAEEILARLPPLDISSIVWDDCEEYEDDDELIKEGDESDDEETLVEKAARVDKDLVTTLNTTNLEYQNGNFDSDGRFKEWHEVTTQKGYQDSPLVVLPYVIMEF